MSLYHKLVRSVIEIKKTAFDGCFIIDGGRGAWNAPRGGRRAARLGERAASSVGGEGLVGPVGGGLGRQRGGWLRGGRRVTYEGTAETGWGHAVGVGRTLLFGLCCPDCLHETSCGDYGVVMLRRGMASRGRLAMRLTSR